jgi:tetratricopeptide (TPR) repeat protein
VAQQRGDYDQALDWYRQSLAIFEQSLPADHPNLAVVRNNYARLFDQLGRTDEATTLRAQAEASR